MLSPDGAPPLFRSRRLVPLAYGGLIVCAAVLGAGQASETFDGTKPLAPARIQQALADCCPVRLQLRDVSDPFIPTFVAGGDPHELREGRRLRRGLVLTPYLRVQEASRRMRRSPEVLEELAAPELWVVAFPYSRDRARALLDDPAEWDGDPLQRLEPHRIPNGEEVFWPREIVLRAQDDPTQIVQPLWSEQERFALSSGLYEEWIPKHSVAVAFPMTPEILERRMVIEVRGVEGVAGGTSRETYETFRLESFSARDWQRALTGERRRRSR